MLRPQSSIRVQLISWGRLAHGFSKDFRLEMKEGRGIYEKLRSYGFPILVKDDSVTHGLGAIDRVEVKKNQKIVPEPRKK